MKIDYRHTLLFLVFLVGFVANAQNKEAAVKPEDEVFTIRGSVYIQGSRIPIEAVDIEVNNGTYTSTNKDGKFIIKAKIGDELTNKHHDFETIFYTIESGERITIEVISGDAWRSGRYKSNSVSKRFNQMIDSADNYLKKDASKSIQFVGDALNANISSNQSAEAHELLGDIYIYWKQYDLAISAFKISIQNASTASAKLKLANAFTKNGSYDESLSTYEIIDVDQLSNYQKTVFYEGIADANLELKNFIDAIDFYEQGLKVAKDHLIAPKVTDFNSKIAQAYNRKGEVDTAKGYFDSSLDLAEKENKKRAVEEKIKVAEFNSENHDYDS